MKKYIVLLLAVMLACGSSAAFAVEYGAEGYENHGQSEADAWEISSVTTLRQILVHVDNDKIPAGSYFKFTSDIDMSVGYADWEGITIDKDKNFTFDGKNHTVKIRIVRTGIESSFYTQLVLGIYYVAYDFSPVGLFGRVESGTIKNLYVSGDITASATHKYWYDSRGNASYYGGEVYAGGIAGKLFGGTIENCKFDGTITVTNNSVESDTLASTIAGGIVGYAFDSCGAVKIIGCQVGSVSPTTISASDGIYDSYAGGLVGRFRDEDSGNTITGNYVRATVKDATATGPLFGFRDGESGTVERNEEADPNAPAGEEDPPAGQEQGQEETPSGQQDPPAQQGSDEEQGQEGQQDQQGQDDQTGDQTQTDTGEQEQGQTQETTSGSSGGSGGSSGGGGCNSGFGIMGLLGLAVIFRRSR